MALPHRSDDRWTVEKLHALPDDGNRYEIIDGVLHVTPSPSYGHQWMLRALFKQLDRYAEPLGITVLWSPADIQYSDRTVVQPDLFAFRNPTGTAPRSWADVQPLLLAVEVVSPSSRRRDREIKRRLFRAQGVPEYWVVDAERRRIERSTPVSPLAEILTAAISWRPESAVTPMHIDLREFFHVPKGD